MARIRTIKPDFFTSESVAALPYSARLTFIGLWTYADDEGRCADNLKLIRAALWPLDDRTLGEIEKDIDEIVSQGMATRYTVGERNYLHVNGMSDHQRINRPTPSKLPPPPTEGDAVSAHAQLNEPSSHDHGVVTEDSPPERKGKEQGKERRNPSRAGVRDSAPELSNGQGDETDLPYAQRRPKRWCDEHASPDDYRCPMCRVEHGDAGYWSKQPKSYRGNP